MCRPAESIVGVEHRIRIFVAQVIFDILAGQRGAAAEHGEIELLPLEVLDHILHFQRRLHQEPAQADGIRFVLLRGFDDDVRRLLDPEIDHVEAVVGENDVDQVLADVVDVTFDRREHDRSFLRAGLLFHLRFEIGHGRLHHAGRIEHRWELHFARAEEVADGFHAVEQHGVDQLERSVLRESIFK